MTIRLVLTLFHIVGIFGESTVVDVSRPSDLFGGDEAGIHGPIDTCSRILHAHGKSICYAFLQKGKCI